MLYTILDTTYRIIHPMIPFISAELWNTLNDLLEIKSTHDDLSFAAWPEANHDFIDSTIHDEMTIVKDIIRSIRNIRSTMNIPPRSAVPVILSFPDEETLNRFAKHISTVSRLGRTEEIQTGVTLERPKNTAADLVGTIAIYVPLKGIINIEDEKNKMRKLLKKKNTALEACNSKLENQGFLENAPQEIVNREWERKQKLLDEIEYIKNFIDHLE